MSRVSYHCICLSVSSRTSPKKLLELFRLCCTPWYLPSHKSYSTPHFRIFPHCECARVSDWVGIDFGLLPCPAVTAASCARPALHSSHPSHQATVLGPPGLEWGLQGWPSALPLLFLSLIKGQQAPSACGERVWRVKREAGEVEGGSRGLGRRQRWETSFWHLVESGCCLEGQPSEKNREYVTLPRGQRIETTGIQNLALQRGSSQMHICQ